MEKVLSFIQRLQRERKIQTLGEEATKQSIVLPILSFLDWEVFDSEEVYPEYAVANTRVDYSLRERLNNKVFIEVKRIDQDLDKHQEQLLNYSFKHGVKLAILTNGISWWFYLPLNEGSWEQRKFYTIDIYAQEAEDVSSRFAEFLSRGNVLTGKAVRNAEHYYGSKRKGKIIEQTIGDAWNKILSEQDEKLIELVAETTERLCGHRPDELTVSRFLSGLGHGTTKTKAGPNREKITPPKLSPVAKISEPVGKAFYESDYTGKKIARFIFRSENYPVASWKEFLIKFSQIAIEQNPQGRNDILRISGKKRAYFTTDPSAFITPAEVVDGIYTETNMNAASMVRMVKRIIDAFNYDPALLVIIVAEGKVTE